MTNSVKLIASVRINAATKNISATAAVSADRAYSVYMDAIPENRLRVIAGGSTNTMIYLYFYS